MPINYVEFKKDDHLENWEFTKDSLDLGVEQNWWLGRCDVPGDTYFAVLWVIFAL